MMPFAIVTAAMASTALATLRSITGKVMDFTVDKAKEFIVDKAINFTVDTATAMVVDKVDGIVNIERDIAKLQKTLGMIQGIVQEAEKKEIDNVYVQDWLSDLVDISLEARDVLEDFIAYSSCIRVEPSSRLVNFIPSRISFLLSYFGGLSNDTSELPLTVLNRLEKDIRDVRERFDEKKKEGKTFATLKSVVGGGYESVPTNNTRPEVGPYLKLQEDNLFLGREEVKEGIMGKLLHPSDNGVHVVAILGMGGIGKTTLAQSIYNDERVKEHDHPIKNRRWSCVGENKFSAEKVIREIVNDKKSIGIGKLQEKLVEELKGGRFLFVLDDVCDVDRSGWNLLFNPLTNVGKGGMIIITTREREVCTAINIQMTYDLKLLSEQDSWSIFESCAYIDGNSDSTPDLKCIGKKIVKKLNGLPLALKVVGCSLLIEKDTHTWIDFLESNEWKLKNNDDDIMPALKWSYDRLPSNLKQCFAYCALFPKDHVFDEKILVEMWMAHDIIQKEEKKRDVSIQYSKQLVKEEQKRPEDVGIQYFKQLVNASLFLCVDGKYMMHDLIHDLALFVSNGEFATANGSLPIDQMETVRHITITPDDYSKILSLHNSKKLLTLYTISSSKEDKQMTEDYYEEDTNRCDDSILDEVFKKLKSIRVLVLSSECIYKIPKRISELKHLRYLDVSQTPIGSLPDSLCHLYHLQVLVVPLDAILPKDIVNMVNLRHVRANLLTCKGVGKLTSLQELSSICVCKDDNIRELGDMQRLRGQLTIEGLENVTSSEDAAGALMEKQTLMHQLELHFYKAEPTISEEVLGALKCPPNLRYLKIVRYTGVELPRWMVDGKFVANLQTLELLDFPKLESLPPLGELESLKHLSLWKVGVKRLGDEFNGKFPFLESLRFDDMQEWEEWDDKIINNSSMSYFPRLTSLEINRCPKLVLVLPTVKNGTSKRKRGDKQPMPNVANFMTSLCRLEIYDCNGLKRLQLDALVSLKELTITRCKSLVQITSSVCLATTIQRLKIHQCELLDQIDFERLPSLKHLDVRGCFKLISVPRLVGIKVLCLLECHSLRSLNINIRGLNSLKHLDIHGCPVLELTIEEGSSSSSSENSVAVPLRISTNNKQIFRKLFHQESVSLQSLDIQKLTGFENFGETGANKFCKLVSLKSLHISECDDLKSLPAVDFHELSSLENMNIECCPQLQSLPLDFHKLSSLNSLSIKYCPQLLSLPPSFGKLSSLQSLHIESCKQLQSLPPDFHKLSSIEYLYIDSYPKLQSLPSEFHKLLSLNSLKIVDCPQLQSLPLEFHKLSSLNSLEIVDCLQLQSLPLEFHKLSSLNILKIVHCPQLQSLPSEFHKLSSLNSLEIVDCPQLQLLDRSIKSFVRSFLIDLRGEICKLESSRDWQVIKRIRNISLSAENYDCILVDGILKNCYYEEEENEEDEEEIF